MSRASTPSNASNTTLRQSVGFVSCGAGGLAESAVNLAWRGMDWVSKLERMQSRREMGVATLWRQCGWAVLCAGLLASPMAVGQEAAPDAPALAAALRAVGKQPVIAVLALNEGTETTDFLVPHAVLRRAGVGTVEVVAPKAGQVVLMPALEVQGARDMASFDAAHPNGADIVIVPAMHVDDDPAIVAWLKAQAAKGATIVGICAGARVLGRAGLLDGRRFTGHWYDRSTLLRRHPGAVHVPDERYLADGSVVTTTGVSASLPLSLALVEALANTPRARALAHELGVAGWGASHRSSRFGLNAAHVWTLTMNTLLFWRHERLRIQVEDGADDIALALSADAWSRTYRSRAEAVHPQAMSVRLRSGLVLNTMVARGDSAPSVVLGSERPACALDKSLAAIGARYGTTTRRWVATQMEHADDPLDGVCTAPD